MIVIGNCRKLLWETTRVQSAKPGDGGGNERTIKKNQLSDVGGKKKGKTSQTEGKTKH